MDQRDKKGAGFEDTFSRYRCGGVGVPPGAFTPEPVCEPEGCPHRIARVLALAHKLDELVRSDEVTDHGELARLGPVSPARRCQTMTLLHLAPAIQQYLLSLAVSQASPISEVGLRRIARESRWDRQRAVFESVLVRKGCLRPPSVSALVWQLTVGLATETVAFSSNGICAIQALSTC